MKASSRNRTKRKKRSAALTKKKRTVAQATEVNVTPRPRRKLPDALRAAGLDEEKIAACFAKQVRQLQSKNPPRIPRKLLLDYLKECVRIVYAPARRGDIPQQPTTVELVHFVPRPDHSDQGPQSAGTPS